MSIHPRRLKSGAVVYDVRLRDPASRLYKRTFRTKREAVAFEAAERADRSRGAWFDHRAGRVTLGEFAERWLGERPDLAPRTRELYRGLLRRHILPELGGVELGKLTTAVVRSWYAGRLSAGVGGVTVAKAYRLLRTVLGTAVEDSLVLKNPCVLKGAGIERTPERPTATVGQVYAIADAIDPRFRAVVLTAAFTGLRLGELLGLTRRRVDLLHGTLRVVEQAQELEDGSIVVRPPKTAAGWRTVALPQVLVPELEAHLARWSGPGPDGLVFIGEKGGPLRRGVLGKEWRRATRAAGVAGLHFHDLRHTGNTLAAATGASTKELMARMGHSSPRAALIYQHATRDRDEAIARALSDLVTGAVSEGGVVPISEATAQDVP